MDEPASGSHEGRVVSRIAAGELDFAGADPASVEERLAAETGSAAWAAENAAPFSLLATVMDLTDRMAAVNGLPEVEQVRAWRDELDVAVEAADDAWGTPTVEIAEFVPENAGELRSRLVELESLVAEHRQHVADLGADDPNVARHRELVAEYLGTAVRATRPFDREA